MGKEVLILNCDRTYPLDSVVSLVKSVPGGKDLDIQQNVLQLSELQAVSESVRQRRLLCGVFVLNAYESRLSINEDRAGIGYAVLYRALREAAQGRVLVVIGGDDRYKEGEQEKTVLSTWAYHKIAAQFDDTYLDGRLGFIFSWDQRHNPIHEEALGKYLRAITSGQPGLQQPFTPSPPAKPKPSAEPSRPPSTSTERTKSQKPSTDSTPDPFTVRKTDRGNRGDPEPKQAGPSITKPKDVPANRRHKDQMATDPKHISPTPPQFAYARFTGNTEEATRIQQNIQKFMKEFQEKDRSRNITFAGYLQHGQLVPGFGTVRGNSLPHLPSDVMNGIVVKAANMKRAVAVVFDEQTSKNCSLVYELTEDDVSSQSSLFSRAVSSISQAASSAKKKLLG